MPTVELEPGADKTIAQLLERKVADTQAMVAITLHAALGETTNRDTGRLAWGWYITVNTPSSAVPPEGKYSIPDFFSHCNFDVNNITVKDKILVTNNVQYGVWVNNGTKKMAPRRFVERALDRLKSAIGGS